MPRAGKRQLNVLPSFSGAFGFLGDAVRPTVDDYTAAVLEFACAFNERLPPRRSELAEELTGSPLSCIASQLRACETLIRPLSDTFDC